MKLYLISLAVGLLVGLIYGVLQVRSPAPPAIALIGLLGMLVGEQMVPAAKRLFNGDGVTVAWLHHECVAKISGFAEHARPAKPAVAEPKRDDRVS